MANDAQVTLCGYVAVEPRFMKLDSGASLTKFRVAFTPRHRNRQTGEWSDGTTTFMWVQCWRKLAENVASSVRKGEPVMVRGRLLTREWRDGAGNDRSEVQLDASSVGHDLTRGVAIFSRTRKSAGRAVAELADADAAMGTAEGTAEDAAIEDAAIEDAALGGVALGDAAIEEGLGGDATVVDESAMAEFARELDETLPGERETSTA